LVLRSRCTGYRRLLRHRRFLGLLNVVRRFPQHSLSKLLNCARAAWPWVRDHPEILATSKPDATPSSLKAFARV
jgi:hypothetical protein